MGLVHTAWDIGSAQHVVAASHRAVFVQDDSPTREQRKEKKKSSKLRQRERAAAAIAQTDLLKEDKLFNKNKGAWLATARNQKLPAACFPLNGRAKQIPVQSHKSPFCMSSCHFSAPVGPSPLSIRAYSLQQACNDVC